LIFYEERVSWRRLNAPTVPATQPVDIEKYVNNNNEKSSHDPKYSRKSHHHFDKKTTTWWISEQSLSFDIREILVLKIKLFLEKLL
jgi:hypothetical protein